MSAPDIAKAYVNFYVSKGGIKSSSSAARNMPDRPFHVSVVTDQGTLETLTKRAPLVADRLVVSHDRVSEPHLVNTRSVDPPSRFEMISRSRPFFGTTDRTYVHCPNLDSLGGYLTAASPLLEAGLVAYIPRISRSSTDPFDENNVVVLPGGMDSSVMPLPREGDIIDVAADLFVSNHRVVEVVGRVHKAKLIEPLLTLELPYLEGVGLRDYSSILVEEGDALSAVQHYLRPKLLNLSTSPDIDAFHTQLALLADEIADGVRTLDNALRHTMRRNAVQVTGAGLAVCTAALFAVDAAALAEVVGALGVSGGIWGLVSAVQQQAESKANARTRPHYLFWVIEKESRKA